MFGKKYLITKNDYVRLRTIMESREYPEDMKSVSRLREKIRRARLIDSRNIKSTVITMNSRVRLKNLGNGSKKEYVLVFPDESDPRNDRISIFDSIGCELFSHEVGEVVRLNSSEGSYFLIENILYQPEAAGDYTL